MVFESFASLFLELEQYGFLDALLPFLLIFTLVFAALQKTKIIGSGEKKFSLIIAFVLAFVTVLPHLTGTYPAGQDVVLIINTALPNISVVLVAILSILVLIGVFMPISFAGSMLGGVLTLSILGAVVFFFGQAAGVWEELPPFLSFLNDPDTQALVIILAIFGFVLWFITREEGSVNMTGGIGKFIRELGGSISR